VSVSGHKQAPDDNRCSMKPRSSIGGLVYSTDSGRMCPGCRRAISLCACSTSAPTSSTSDGIVRISRETKGRGGKVVTVVRGLAIDVASLEKMAKQLKAACGSGGAVKDGVVEVQGDHCDKVLALLAGQGFKVKRAGG
jgi:translation initiation factor 1